jgi:hypothetical protein
MVLLELFCGAIVIGYLIFYLGLIFSMAGW